MHGFAGQFLANSDLVEPPHLVDGNRAEACRTAILNTRELVESLRINVNLQTLPLGDETVATQWARPRWDRPLH